MSNRSMKYFYLFLIFLAGVKNSNAQYKWSVGAYFIPSYLQYSFGQQQININLISGLGVSRQVTNETIVNSGLFYFRNQLYGDTYACSTCQSSPIEVVGSYKSEFIEIPIGVKYKLSKKLSKFTPYVMGGLVSTFHLYIKETNIDISGNRKNFHKGFGANAGHGYFGLSLIYEINYRTFLLIDPVMRFGIAETAYGIPIYTYRYLFGLGVGINIKL